MSALQIAAPREPQIRECWREVYVRDAGLVRRAKEVYGTRCLCAGCSNSFFNDDGAP